MDKICRDSCEKAKLREGVIWLEENIFIVEKVILLYFLKNVLFELVNRVCKEEIDMIDM